MQVAEDMRYSVENDLPSAESYVIGPALSSMRQQNAAAPLTTAYPTPHSDTNNSHNPNLFTDQIHHLPPPTCTGMHPPKQLLAYVSAHAALSRTYSMRQSRAPTASQIQNPPPPSSSTKAGRFFGRGNIGTSRPLVPILGHPTLPWAIIATPPAFVGFRHTVSLLY